MSGVKLVFEPGSPLWSIRVFFFPDGRPPESAGVLRLNGDQARAFASFLGGEVTGAGGEVTLNASAPVPSAAVAKLERDLAAERQAHASETAMREHLKGELDEARAAIKNEQGNAFQSEARRNALVQELAAVKRAKTAAEALQDLGLASTRVAQMRAERDSASRGLETALVDERFANLRNRGRLSDRELALFFYLKTGRADYLKEFDEADEEGAEE